MSLRPASPITFSLYKLALPITSHYQRMKRRALRTMKLWSANRPLLVDPRDLGVNISTHCRRCAC